jgi:hypothetical protein
MSIQLLREDRILPRGDTGGHHIGTQGGQGQTISCPGPWILTLTQVPDLRGLLVGEGGSSGLKPLWDHHTFTETSPTKNTPSFPP